VQDKKIQAITKKDADIIFLCDIRLNSNKQKYACHDLEKKFKFKGYDFYHNSTINSRGVGILIRTSLGITPTNSYADNECNILLLTCNVRNTPTTIGSLYGPNFNDKKFFSNLDSFLDLVTNNCIILGGDLNATWDQREANENIDVINMQNIQSKFRTEKLHQLANKFNLTDPYRFINPCRREFTYIPNARNSNNRSRLDFFLISDRLCSNDMCCWIENSLISTAFDHKLIGICWNKKKLQNKNRGTVSDQIIRNPAIQALVKCVVFECHLTHADPDAVPAYIKKPIAREYRSRTS
jgi:exonuclease III